MSAKISTIANPAMDIPNGESHRVKYDGWHYTLMSAECKCRRWQVCVGFGLGWCRLCDSPLEVAHE